MRQRSSFDRREDERDPRDFRSSDPRGRRPAEDYEDPRERWAQRRPLAELERDYDAPDSERRRELDAPRDRRADRFRLPDYTSGERERTRQPFHEDLEEWQRPWQQSGRVYGPAGGPYAGRGDSFGRGGTGSYAGRGPKNYQRSDERLREEICDRLTDDPQIDATEIAVSVRDAEVTLEGTVPQRSMKRMAEDIAESVSGVQEVHNQLRTHRPARGVEGSA